VDRSQSVGIEFMLSWNSVDAVHVDRCYLPEINFRRDVIPGSVGERLAATRGETEPRESFTAGALVEPYREANVRRLRRDQLASAFGRHSFGKLHLGRFYPRGIAAGAVSSVFPRETKPLRVTACDDEQVTVDFNHPLAQYPLTLAAHMCEERGDREERGGQCNDIAQLVTSAGPGLQARLAETPTDFFDQGCFSRSDESDDPAFYRTPRFVDHLDAVARARVTEIYARFLHPGARVLDLMSSWNSHLPRTLEGLRVTGLGINREELERNPRLSEHLVQDINRRPELPFADAQFDAAICTVSVEYLTRPKTVFREVARTLHPGAPFVLTFSERWFPPKVVRLWTQLHPFERMGLVLEYFRRSEAFEELGSESIRGLFRPADDKYAALTPYSDTVYAVWGLRRQDWPRKPT
jgi:SAM-dependent methyltransferase